MYVHMYVSRVDAKMSIRVADFGLTRDICSTKYYRVEKLKHAMLPVKWMSLESLLDGYFDEKTDVVRMCLYNIVQCVHMFCVQPLASYDVHNYV